MAAASSADQLERVLYLIPRATGPEGVPLADLAADLGVGEACLLDDIAEVTDRAYYHPAGWVTDLEIGVEEDRVQVWTSGEFVRPVRLSPGEALALALGLRLLADGTDEDDRADLLELALRLDGGLTVASAEPMAASFALDGGDPRGSGMVAVARDAAAERRRCRILYLKPGEAQPEARLIDPYALVFASGRWYAIGQSAEANAVRAFRLDRVLEIEATEETFQIPDGFDPGDYVEEGAVFRAWDEVEASVRYSPRIARWIAEREEVEPRPDGSVVVRRRVADPRWIVRHVLAYGPEAELVEPEELRALVRRTLSGDL